MPECTLTPYTNGRSSARQSWGDVKGLVRMGSPYFFESIVATSAARIARNADEARVTMHLPLGSAGCRVARASRVLVLASRQNGLFQLCLS